MKIDSGAVRGFCAKGKVNSVVRRRAGAIRACYERRLMVKPQLAGKLKVRWIITPNGRTGDVSVTQDGLKDKEVMTM